MYYVVECRYTGPDSGEDCDFDTIEISKLSPVISYFSGGVEIREGVVCHSWGDMTVYAYGPYDTLREAGYKVAELPPL